MGCGRSAFHSENRRGKLRKSATFIAVVHWLSVWCLMVACRARSSEHTATARGSPVSSTAPSASEPVRAPDVLYVPTPQPVVDRMLELARLTSSDVVYDLGCGDGRIVVTAAERYGARAIGFDIDPARVAEARAKVREHGVEALVSIEQKDIFTLDLKPASVVALYLLPQLNVRLLPQLEQMRPGSRIVSHDFDIAGVVPLEALTLRPPGEELPHSIYFFEIPLKKTE